MKVQTLLGTAAILAATLVARPSSAEPVCSFSAGKSCCNEERHNNLGSPLGTDVVQAPSIITADGGASYDIFAQGWDNAVWTRHFIAGTWGSWQSLGGVTTSRPTAVTTGTNHVYLFARGPGNQAWYRERNGSTWGGWTTMGGTILGGVGAAAWPSGEVEVFVVGTDHALWRNSLTGTAQAGWTSLGGNLYGDPTATHVKLNAGDRIDVWAMASDKQVWRRMHSRVPITVRFFTTMTDTWSAWKAQLNGTTGGVGLFDYWIDLTVIAIRDTIGNVYLGNASAASVWVGMAETTMTTRSDVSMAPPGTDGSSVHYAYVDCDTAAVEEFHYEPVCTTCGDGRCYGTETCSSCPTDCGACPPTCGNHICEAGESCSGCPSDCGACPTPPSSCQDYKFCSKASLDATSGLDITGYGCNIADARKDAFKKVWGGVLQDGPCPPAACGGSTPWVKEWCCKGTGTTYFGAACSQDDADKAAKNNDTSCSSWSEGICD